MPSIMFLLNIYYSHKLVEILRPAVRWRGGQILLLASVKYSSGNKWAEHGMGCPGPGCTMYLTPLQYLIWASKIHLCTCLDKWRWSLISDTWSCWVYTFPGLWHAGFSSVSDKDSEGNWVTHLHTKAFTLPFGGFCRIVRSFPLCQSWEESSCSCDDKVCY